MSNTFDSDNIFTFRKAPFSQTQQSIINPRKLMAVTIGKFEN